MGMTNLGNVFLRRAERQKFEQLLNQLSGNQASGHPLNTPGLPTGVPRAAAASPNTAAAAHPLAQGVNPQALQMARMLGQYSPQAGMAFLMQQLGPQQQAEPVETFSTVHNPYGLGGVGQVSSTTGKIVGYQSPKGENALTQRYDAYKSAGGKLPIDDFLKLSSPSTNVSVSTGQQRPKPGQGFRWKSDDPDSQQYWEQEPIRGGSADKFNEQQVKAMNTAQSMDRGLAVLSQPTESGKTYFENLAALGDTAQSMIPGVGNFMLSPEYQQGQQAFDEMVRNMLRLETGAQANESEIKEIRKNYMPKPGDSPEVIQQKWNALMAIKRQSEAAAGQRYGLVFGGDGSVKADNSGVTIGPLTVNGQNLQSLSDAELDELEAQLQ